MAKDMMDRLFDNGREGELYRIDDEWWFRDDWQRASRNADWAYKASENPVRYHSEWMKRTVEDDYDYSALIDLFRTISTGTYTQTQIERLVDAEATLVMAAVRGYIGDWDSFTLDRGKNGYMYRRWSDGKFMFLHWDRDLASNYGNCVDWFAPGVSITSAWSSSNTATSTISGTSMATPHTTGVAALHLQGAPTTSPAAVRQALYDLTTKGVVKSSSTANNHLLFTNY